MVTIVSYKIAFLAKKYLRAIGWKQSNGDSVYSLFSLI